MVAGVHRRRSSAGTASILCRSIRQCRPDEHFNGWGLLRHSHSRRIYTDFLCKLVAAPAELYDDSMLAAENFRQAAHAKADLREIRDGLMRLIAEGVKYRDEVLRTDDTDSISVTIEDWYRRTQILVRDRLGEAALERLHNPNRKITHRPVGQFSKKTFDTWVFFERILPVLDEYYRDSKK